MDAGEVPHAQPLRSATAGVPAVHGDTVTLDITFIETLGAIAKEYEALAKKTEGSGVALAAINERLDAIVDRLMRKWVISQVEIRSIAPGVSADKSYEVLVGEYLDRQLPDVSGRLAEEDIDDLSYLRWLTGRSLPEHVDTSDFNRRWAHRRN